MMVKKTKVINYEKHLRAKGRQCAQTGRSGGNIKVLRAQDEMKRRERLDINGGESSRNKSGILSIFTQNTPRRAALIEGITPRVRVVIRRKADSDQRYENVCKYLLNFYCVHTKRCGY